jgi:hypothetical protein
MAGERVILWFTVAEARTALEIDHIGLWRFSIFVFFLCFIFVFLGCENRNLVFLDAAGKEYDGGAIKVCVVERDFKEELCNEQSPRQDMGLAAYELSSRNRQYFGRRHGDK